MPSPAPHPGLSQKRADPGGGIVHSAEVVHGAPRPPALPPELELPLAPLDPLDPLAPLLLDALALVAPPAPLLLDVLAPPAPPAPLLLDAPPPLPDEDEREDDEDESPADVVVGPVVEGPLSPHPRRSEDIPVRTETSARREAKRGTRGMIAIVPPSPDRPART